MVALYKKLLFLPSFNEQICNIFHYKMEALYTKSSYFFQLSTNRLVFLLQNGGRGVRSINKKFLFQLYHTLTTQLESGLTAADQVQEVWSPMTPSLTPSLVWRQHCLLEPPTTTYSPLENQFTQLGSQPRLRSFPIYQIGTLKYIRLEGKFFVFEKVDFVVVAFKTYFKEAQYYIILIN